MTYQWVDHTSELELHIDAPTAEQVFQDALAALAELLGEDSGEPQQHEIELVARDRPALLAQWLEELIFLAETAQFVPGEADVDLESVSLRATVRGHLGEPSPLVKAVTYHHLLFEEGDGRWRARVVLDV